MLTYFILCTLSFAAIMWYILKPSNKRPPSDDDGGMPLDNGLPIIDLPPANSLDDIMVDRWYDRDTQVIRQNK